MKRIEPWLCCLCLILMSCGPRDPIVTLAWDQPEDSRRTLVSYRLLRDPAVPTMRYPAVLDIYVTDLTVPERPFCIEDFEITAATNLKTYREFRNTIETAVSPYEVHYFDIANAMTWAWLDRPTNDGLAVHRVDFAAVTNRLARLKERRVRVVPVASNTTWWCGSNRMTNEQQIHDIEQQENP